MLRPASSLGAMLTMWSRRSLPPPSVERLGKWGRRWALLRYGLARDEPSGALSAGATAARVSTLAHLRTGL